MQHLGRIGTRAAPGKVADRTPVAVAAADPQPSNFAMPVVTEGVAAHRGETPGKAPAAAPSRKRKQLTAGGPRSHPQRVHPPRRSKPCFPGARVSELDRPPRAQFWARNKLEAFATGCRSCLQHGFQRPALAAIAARSRLKSAPIWAQLGPKPFCDRAISVAGSPFPIRLARSTSHWLLIPHGGEGIFRSRPDPLLLKFSSDEQS